MSSILLIAVSTIIFIMLTMWHKRAPDPGHFLAAMVCTLFPYWQSQLYFSFQHLAFAFSLCLPMAAIALLHQWCSRWCAAAAAVLLACALGFYQASMHTYLCLLLVISAVHAADGANLKGECRILLVGGLSAICGIFLYFIIHKIVLQVSGLGTLPADIDTVRVSFDLKRFLSSIVTLLHGNNILLPTWQHGLLFVPATVAVLAAFRHLSSLRAAFLLFCLLTAFLSITALALVTSHGLAPRTSVALAFWWAGVVLLLNELCKKKIRLLCNCVFAICLLFFMLNANNAWRILNEISQYDLVQAMQIKNDLRRFASANGLEAPYNLSIIGCIDENKLPWPVDFPSLTGYSMLSCLGSKHTVGQHPYGLLGRAGANDFAIRPIRSFDLERVGKRQPWPAEQGIFIDDEGLVLWLGPVQREQKLDAGFRALACHVGVQDPAWLDSATEKKLPPSYSWFADAARQKPDGPWPAKKGARATLFAIDNMVSLGEESRFNRVIGWAHDLQYGRPDLIFLLNDQGMIIGFAHTGMERPDLGSKIASMARKGGWIGYVLKKQCVERAVYYAD